MVGDAFAVVDADDWLGPVNPVVEVFQDPISLEVGVEALQVWNELFQQLRRFLAVQFTLAVRVIGEIDDVVTAVKTSVDHVGMFNNADER